MVQFLRYESYKDSGVEWVGEIPDAWKVLPLTKYTTSLVDYRGKTPTKVDFGIFLVTAKNIKNGIIDYRLSQEYIAENKYAQVMSRGKPQIGDLLFTTEAPLGEVALVDKTKIALAQRIIKFRLDKRYLLPTFTKYFLISNYFQNYLQTEATGSTAQGIKSSKLHKLKVIAPSLKEQQEIVNFLDKKTAEIDKAIAKKQKLIELLQEQKAILINRAVTKGLNPNVPMRDLGIELIGEIPEHWTIKKLKYLSCIRYGLGQPPKEKHDGLPLIRATNIERGIITSKNLIRVDEDDIPYDRNPILKEDEIYVVRSGAYTADSAIVTKKYAGSIAGYDMVVTVKKVMNAKFLAYCFLSKYVLLDQLFLLRMRAAQPHLNAEELGETLILARNRAV